MSLGPETIFTDSHEAIASNTDPVTEATGYGTAFNFREYLRLKGEYELAGSTEEQLAELHEAFHGAAARALKELDDAELLQYK